MTNMVSVGEGGSCNVIPSSYKPIFTVAKQKNGFLQSPLVLVGVLAVFLSVPSAFYGCRVWYRMVWYKIVPYFYRGHYQSNTKMH